jgi:hypothetical protein
MFMQTKKRPHVLSVTLTADELLQFQILAEGLDMPMTSMVRSWLRREVGKAQAVDAAGSAKQ